MFLGTRNLQGLIGQRGWLAGWLAAVCRKKAGAQSKPKACSHVMTMGGSRSHHVRKLVATIGYEAYSMVGTEIFVKFTVTKACKIPQKKLVRKFQLYPR